PLAAGLVDCSRIQTRVPALRRTKAGAGGGAAGSGREGCPAAVATTGANPGAIECAGDGPGSASLSGCVSGSGVAVAGTGRTFPAVSSGCGGGLTGVSAVVSD